MAPIRVLLADDHSIVRTGIRTILNGLTGVESSGRPRTAVKPGVDRQGAARCRLHGHAMKN